MDWTLSPTTLTRDFARWHVCSRLVIMWTMSRGRLGVFPSLSSSAYSPVSFLCISLSPLSAYPAYPQYLNLLYLPFVLAVMLIQHVTFPCRLRSDSCLHGQDVTEDAAPQQREYLNRRQFWSRNASYGRSSSTTRGEQKIIGL
ncbi:hypothetical protein BD410DRAFT_785865 [Rickenella mellea]|uniref:Uncharacterized protein n=1 Tax=Rickenella mellea TaxID=50990 RepID=A0A4Y7Q9Z7_9AGAM|nr:hypothetical protein BD410DRAFT_785865 [Rickenella mellea]